MKIYKFFIKNLVIKNICSNFANANRKNNGVVAQLVEQRTENPCVTGSNPVDATPI